MMAHWTSLVLIHNDAGTVRDDYQRHLFLEELRVSGTMGEAFLTRTWGKHEDPKDRRTWGPLRRNIDWTGFDPDPSRAAPAPPNLDA